MSLSLRPARTPNEEQAISIYHNGGKLLSAGAGSGKTFVLIEHLAHLLNQAKNQTAKSDWNSKIPSFLSQIVLMTFTNKAAGEMSIRMAKKVEELVQSAEVTEDDFLFWSIVRKNLSFLNIVTIHGFCHRLLRMGIWASFPQEINLVSSVEHKDKIQKLFTKWFYENFERLDPLFLSNSNALLKAMVEIFSSPELRIFWRTPDAINNPDEQINLFFAQLLELSGYREIFTNDIDLQTQEKEKSKKWYELLYGFALLKQNLGTINSSNYNQYNNFFNMRFPDTRSKEISTQQRITLGQIKIFRDELKKFIDDFNALGESFAVFKNWSNIVSELFNYIDSNYLSIDGFHFSDLEYYTHQALEVPEVLKKVTENYSYFIVDEFQDTSQLQFEILKKLINEKKEKIFCVGDRKQAIYGFRGGELQVFSECASLLGSANNYFLKNNFRSLREIIEFNNILFESVFPLGLEYEGHDPHSVVMEPQVVPLSDSLTKGSVIRLKSEVINNGEEFDIDYVESIKLAEHLKELIDSDEYGSICVLYRKLRPSRYLLEHLLQNGVAFNAQIKIKFSDDPLLTLFLYLVELELNKLKEIKYDASKKLLSTLLDVLEVLSFDDRLLKQFSDDVKLIGLQQAFHKFVYAIGISNAFHKQNYELIDAICKMAKDNLIRVHSLLSYDDSQSYACEMISGEASNVNKRIIIMTAHASKGLEFDAVLLGGVHTNGRDNGVKDIIGKIPHSFKWKKSIEQKNFHKSPLYHLETKILGHKNFSESKRLLYVACTRAIKHLAFVDLWRRDDSGEAVDLVSSRNSWIQALRKVSPETIHSQIAYQQENKMEIALIHKDALGVVYHQRQSSLGVVAELSVTRLATLASCSFKFYLQNICKINVDQENSLSSFDELEETFHSSKKRGTLIHGYLSKLFLKQLTMESIPLMERDKVKWAYELGKTFFHGYHLISEQMIKFSLFGQMISGTPDLVFHNMTDKLIVWDFKTGLRDEQNEDNYWFQLLCYAYAYSQSLQYTGKDQVELSLLYVDQKAICTKTYSVDEITQALFWIWKKTESLNQVNSEHCPQCEYRSLCQKGKSHISCEPTSLC